MKPLSKLRITSGTKLSERAVQQQLDALTDKLNELIKSTDSTSSASSESTDLSAVEADIDALETDVAAVETDVAALSASLTSLTSTVSALTGDVETLESNEQVLQAIELSLASDTNTTDANEPPTVVLLSQSITIVSGSVLEVDFEYGGTNSASGSRTLLSLYVGSTEHDRLRLRCQVNGDGAFGDMKRRLTGLAAGAHTVQVRWGVTGGATITCNGSSGVPNHHARLILKEVTPAT